MTDRPFRKPPSELGARPKNIDEFINKKFREYLKVYLVLKIKGYTWKGELLNSFSIGSIIANESLKILERDGYVISKDFWSLDLDMQEIIRRLDGAYFNKVKTWPKIYILNYDEAKLMWWENYKDEIKELIRNDGSMEHTMSLIDKKTKSYKKLQRQFNEIENSQMTRFRVDPETGIIYETQTRKAKELKNNISTAILALKKDNLLAKSNQKLLSKKENTQLQKTKTKALSTQSKTKSKPIISEITFNGKTITASEFEQLKKNEKNIDKEPVEKGMPEDEIEKHHAIRFKALSEDLGLEEGPKNKKEHSQDQKRLDLVINTIKEKKWMDYFNAERACGSERVFKKFTKIAKDHNIFFDGEDFRYEG